MCLNKNITLLIYFFLNHLHRQSVTLLLYHYFLSKYHIKKNNMKMCSNLCPKLDVEMLENIQTEP